MRQIVFRGKDLKTKQWVYGSYLMLKPSAMRKSGAHYIIDRFNHDALVDSKTVGQFTGLKDKNGVEIYEGDIIELMLHTGEKEKFICEYKTEKNGFRFISQEANDDCWYIVEGNNTIEVVGNIHD